jgi:hypothetical protein
MIATITPGEWPSASRPVRTQHRPPCRPPVRRRAAGRGRARRLAGQGQLDRVGTIILGILTAAGFSTDHVKAGDHEEGRLATEVIAMALISIAFALINLGHITGLLIFQGVRFQGRPTRFMARISLFGTPLAILVCVVLLLIASN